jgi:hypothetical protein
LTGGLVGWLGGPIGTAGGVSVGALAGLALDLGQSGIDFGFLNDVSKAMTPRKVAVLAEVQETWETPADLRPRKRGGLVFRRLRSGIIEDQLAREATALHAERQRLREELAEESAEAEDAVQAQLHAIEKRLVAIQSQANARAEQAKHELDSKIAAMRDQMKHASHRQKARIQKRIVDAETDYAVRSGRSSRRKCPRSRWRSWGALLRTPRKSRRTGLSGYKAAATPMMTGA